MQEKNSELFVTYQGMKVLEQEYWELFDLTTQLLIGCWSYELWLQAHLFHAAWRRVNAKCLRLTPDALNLTMTDDKGQNYRDIPF